MQSSTAASVSDEVTTVDDVLLKLALSDYIDKFHTEQIDLDALVSISLCYFVTTIMLISLNK